MLWLRGYAHHAHRYRPTDATAHAAARVELVQPVSQAHLSLEPHAPLLFIRRVDKRRHHQEPRRAILRRISDEYLANSMVWYPIHDTVPQHFLGACVESYSTAD